MIKTSMKQEFALVGATLVDGKGNDPIKDSVIIVKNGLIDRILELREFGARSDLYSIDVSGCFVMPGLIDSHVHLAGIKTSWDLDGVIENKYLKCIRSVADSWKLLEHGITTVRDMSWNGLYLKRAIKEKTIVGPRIVAYGPPLGRTGGHADLRRDIYDLPSDYVRQHAVTHMLCDGIEEVRKVVRELIGRGADGIKLYASGTNDMWDEDHYGDIAYSYEELKTISDETHLMEGFKVAAHASSLKAVKLCLKAGIDTIEHGRVLDEETCQDMIRKNTFLIPTIAVATVGPWAKTESQMKLLIKNYAMARELGVKIAMGSDTCTETITPYGEHSLLEIRKMVEAGFSNMGAIVAATKTSSEVCGISHKVGVIETGKIADLLVLKRDPLSDIEVLLDKENIRFLFQEGNLLQC